jgi:hypothetical protein
MGRCFETRTLEELVPESGPQPANVQGVCSVVSLGDYDFENKRRVSSNALRNITARADTGRNAGLRKGSSRHANRAWGQTEPGGRERYRSSLT